MEQPWRRSGGGFENVYEKGDSASDAYSLGVILLNDQVLSDLVTTYLHILCYHNPKVLVSKVVQD